MAKKKKPLLLLRHLLPKLRLRKLLLRWKLLLLKPLRLTLRLLLKLLLLKLLRLTLLLPHLLPSNSGFRNEKPAFGPVFFRLRFAVEGGYCFRNASSRAIASISRGSGWV